MKRDTQELKVGIAIIAWNNESIIATCLDSVKAQTFKNIKTIVLDNNSSDNTVKVIKDGYKWVHLIESQENTGFSKGNNIIIQKFIVDKDIDYMVLLNSDATLESDWVSLLVEFAQGSQRLAMVQGLTLDYYNHEIVDSTHIYINRNGQATQAGYRQPKSSISSHPKEVFGVNAAACMISKKFLQNQPFDYVFDEDFFMYLEDVDFAARAFVEGWNSYSVPSAIAYHMGSESAGKNPGFSVYMVNRNRLPLLMKNFPATILLRLMPRMLKADILELVHIAKGKNYRVINKFVIGRLKGVIITPLYIRKRLKLSKHRMRTTQQIWSTMNDGLVPEE